VPAPGGDPALAVDPAARRRAGRAIFLYAASGFLGLVVEVAFTRSLVLVFGSTTYAFSTVLAVFLLGIALGGALGTVLARKNALRRLEVIVPVTAVLFSVSALAIHLLPRLYVRGWTAAGGDFDATLWLRFGLSALVLLPGSLGLGVAFPLAAQVATASGIGKGTGRLYAWNTLASVVGSTLAVFLLIPWLGMQYAVAMVAVGVASAAALIARRPALFLLVPLAALALWPPSGPAQERLLSGVFYQPGRWLRDGEIDERAWALGDDIPFHAYGREATVALSNWYGKPGVLVDGKTVASAGLATDVQHLALLGHLPMLVHPDPRSVLVVGLGMGTTYEAVRLHQPPRLVVVELEPVVAQATAKLGIEPEALVLTDARTHLRATDERYDVITSDPIHPWVRGGGDLYSLEYYQLCRSRLAEGGVMCQWVPLYQMGLADVPDAVRTFVHAFPSAVAYFTGADLVLLGTASGEVSKPRRVGATLTQALDALGAADLDALVVGDAEAMREATTGARILVDDELRLEFSTPRQMANPEMADVMDWVVRLWGTPPAPWGDLIAAQQAHLKGDGAGLSDALDRARTSHPHHGFVKMFEGEYYLRVVPDLARAGKVELAERFLRHAATRLGDDSRLLGVEGDLWEIAGDKERARAAFTRLLERTPESRYLRRRLDLLR
jgi:spermidine synthase